MRIPLSWLAEFVTWSGPAAALAERLTMAGLKIEAIEEVGQLALYLCSEVHGDRWLARAPAASGLRS